VHSISIITIPLGVAQTKTLYYVNRNAKTNVTAMHLHIHTQEITHVNADADAKHIYICLRLNPPPPLAGSYGVLRDTLSRFVSLFQRI